MLPNGKEYCAEDARTEEEKDDCTGDLEDGMYASNRDKERGMGTLRKGVERIKLSRNPCGFFDFGCRKRQKALDRSSPTNGN